MQKTIKQVNFLGNERDYTLEQYVAIWTAQVADLYNIAVTDADYQKTKDIRASVEDMATRTFENIYQSQNKAA